MGIPGNRATGSAFPRKETAYSPFPYMIYFYRYFLRSPIYISLQILYSNREQSRRRRVKCHRDGEFARRTKDFSTMLSPHPLLHIGTNLLYVATILGRANGRLYIAALSHRSSGKPAAPRRFWRWGFFVFRAVGTGRKPSVAAF